MFGVVAVAIQHPRLAAAVAGLLLVIGLVLLFFIARLVRRGWRRWKAVAYGARRSRLRDEPARRGGPRRRDPPARRALGRTPGDHRPRGAGRVRQRRRVVPRPRLPGARGRDEPRRGSAPAGRQLRGRLAGATSDGLTHRGGPTPRPDGAPAPGRPARRRRRVRPGASRALVHHAVRHHRRARGRPAGHRRPARVVPGPRGQAAGGRRLGRRRRRAGAVPHRRPGRRRRPRRGHRRAPHRAGSGVVRRRPRRLQRRWRLRALAARRPRPGRGRGVLPAPVRPGAGAAVPGGRAVLDPRVRAARRYGGAAARRDRHAA